MATGYEALLTSALKGKGAMGAQSGGAFSDVEIGRAVVHLANAGGASFAEPSAPAAADGAAPAADIAAAAPVVVAAATSVPAPVAAAAPSAPASATVAAASGEALYKQACQVCHAAGVAGAPKLADKAAWAPRLALGLDGLTASVIKGKGAMPPKGGSSASDAEIKASVAYMLASIK